MTTTLDIARHLKTDHVAEKPAEVLTQRIVRRSATMDSNRRYLTDAPSPARFAALMKDIDFGDIAAAVELNQEMEAKDAHLQNVAARRRESVTALDWNIIPDPNAKDVKAADEAAAFCQQQLDDLKTWEETLEHVAEAIGPGVSVVELIWHRARLVETNDVPGHRLSGSMRDGLGVYVLTDDQPTEGVVALSPKFAVYTPNCRAGFPMRVTITRAQALLWVIKHFSIADWAGFNETYGQPVRVAKFTRDVTREEKAIVQNMLENMGSDLWAMFGDAVDLTMLEAARNSQPFEGMVDWVERKQSILYLGQTLTTEQGNVGSLALGGVHENVRASITLSDIKKERRFVRGNILSPMTAFRFPGRNMPVPHFQRRVIEARDLDADRVMMEKLRMMDERKLPVDPEFIYEALAIPKPLDKTE